MPGAGGGGQTEFGNSRDLVELCRRGPGLGCRIDGNGFDAVKPAPAGDFNVLLKEMQMPTMEGFEAVRMLRELGCARPTIALTVRQGGLEVERAGRGILRLTATQHCSGQESGNGQ